VHHTSWYALACHAPLPHLISPQNTLFNSALRQSNSIRKDLTTLSSTPTSSTPALQGQLSASLTSFSRTIDEYASLAKQEPIPEKAEKAQVRIKNFRAELVDFRDQFERVRKEVGEQQAVNNRQELLGRRPHHTSTPENPYANAAAAPQQSVFRPSAAHAQASPFGASPADYGREQHAMREQNFMSGTNAQLDEFLERGRAVLGDLGQQREMLKGTQKRLFDVANTLGISGDTIRMVERRAKQDKWVFGAGVAVFVVFVWLVLRYLR
jgi:Golgi SNAP receptor complex protein 2